MSNLLIKHRLPKIEGDWHEYEGKIRKKNKNGPAFNLEPSTKGNPSQGPSSITSLDASNHRRSPERKKEYRVNIKFNS
jgi:hypothetical protein